LLVLLAVIGVRLGVVRNTYFMAAFRLVGDHAVAKHSHQGQAIVKPHEYSFGTSRHPDATFGCCTRVRAGLKPAPTETVSVVIPRRPAGLVSEERVRGDE